MTGFRNIFRTSQDRDRGRRSPDAGSGSLAGDKALEDALRDPVLAALADELASLGDVTVPASARHRGLSLVREEFARQERRGVLGPARGRGLLFRGRLALGSVVVVLAAFLGLVGLYGGGEAPQWTGSTDAGGPGATPAGPGTSTPEVSGPTLSTLPVPGDTVTTVVDSTQTTGVTTTPAPSSTAPGPTGTTTAPSTGTSMRPPATTGTTAPAGSTSTTGRAVLTREQRESSARSLALFLSNKVIVGDTDGAGSVLAGSAGPGFVQLVSSLEAPYATSIVSVVTTDGPTTRVLVEFRDRVAGPDGSTEVARRYYYEMKVDASGALVTSIYQAPAP